jgi:murein DD-endopeptidase MepM/ murein hydrolase activator NlpD
VGVHLEVVRRILFLPLALLPALLAARPEAPPPPEPVRTLAPAPGPFAAVVPGGVVRWTGAALSLCGDARETWKPVGGACYYPVDLGVEAKELEVFRERLGARETATLRILPPPYAEESLEVDPRKVKLSAKDLARVERERKEVAPVFSLRTEPAFALPFSPPLAKAPAPRNFGTRRVFNGEPRSPHGGADFRAATGTPVLAAEKGLVVLVANHFFAGRSVFVDHGGGLVSMYMHLSATKVRAGQRVARGDVLGLSGATGRVSGPHLHFGLKWRGARVDPALLLGDPAKLPSP